MKEIRSNEQITAGAESRKVEGYGVVFNSESVDLGGFREIILPTAITEETIKRSDILFLLDHNRERGILARSKNGSGSLSVSIDERGVRYEFDAPKTALGDEVLEGLRRQDINKCSFAFSVSRDSWVKMEDGSILRTIEEIDRLYDISIVYNPAYEETLVVNKRGLDELEERETEAKKDEEKPESEDEAKEEANCDADEERSENPDNEDDAPADDEAGQDETEEREADPEESDEEDETPADDEEHTETEERNNNLYNKVNSNHNIMNKNKFSFIGTLNDAINMRANDFVKYGQIVLPLETRAEGDTPATPEAPATANGILAGVENQGGISVDSELWDLMTDLKDRMILNELGAQFLTADSNIEIPRYSAGQAGWAGEIEHAKDAAGKFSSIKLSPMRLSAYVDISNTWLNMTSANAESILRQEIVNCIALKLQQTIFGNGKGSDVEPQGLFYGVTADTAAFKYDDVVDIEAALESANVYGDGLKYAVNPKTKAALRGVKRDAGSGLFVWENNSVEGTPALSSNSLVEKGLIYGDWSQLLVCFFGGNVRLVVDTLTRAVYNQTRIVVNLDVNYCVKRPEAFVKRILK